MRKNGKVHRRRRRLVALALSIFIFTMVSGCDSGPTDLPENEVFIGGLFSLTGNWSTLGKTSQAAMDLAVEDVNRYLEGNAAGISFATAVENTRLEPSLALEMAQTLRARGVQILIGPQSSAEVAHLKEFVDANQILLISPSSTAGSLAIPEDNIFRFTPSDTPEGVAVATMAMEDGIQAMVPVWREDDGNEGLHVAIRAAFSEVGGTVAQGISYGPDVRDFAGTVAELRRQVDQAIATDGTSGVAVYLAAFDEAADLFSSAATDPVLSSVRWYGSNGVALSEAIRGDPQAAAFAIRVNYAAPIFGRDAGARDIWAPLIEQIQARTTLEPDAFALAVYDAVWVAARAYVASGATEDIEQLKHAFITAAASGYGATGWTVLNEAGDRRYGDFDFWAIQMLDGAPRWIRIAVYESRTGRLVR